MPAERLPAPEPLEVVREFVNTFDVESGTEELDGPAALVSWFVARDLVSVGTRATRADLERAHGLREALRSLMLANNGEPLDERAVASLNQAADRIRLQPRFDVAGRVVVIAGGAGIDAALGKIVAIVLGAMADDTWSRLKVCREDSCQWAFYDHSRNRSGQWCVMAVCGNRNKARSFRARKSEAH
jgi:predicted RNA-binding Zn ribbon-like protein